VIEKRLELMAQINLGWVTELPDIRLKMMLDLREEPARIYHNRPNMTGCPVQHAA
jgi:hypothetical protein